MSFNNSPKLQNLISVIIPVYNGELFVEAAYKQIINQNLKNFEIIFVDNNSTDQSTRLIRKLVKSDQRVYLFKESRQGAACARNTGLKHAKGAFIYFFDVDDELFDNGLNALLQVLVKYPYLDSAFGKIEQSTLKLNEIAASTNDTDQVHIPDDQHWGLFWMTYSNLPGTPCFIHRRRVFDKIGCFNMDLRVGEDAAFHVKLGMECTVGYLDKTILLYYRHAQSTITSLGKKQSKVFTYWEPLIHAHIPYMLKNKAPLKFNEKVLLRTYGSIPQMLALTKGYMNKKRLKRKLIKEIRPLKIPLALWPFINLIMLTESTWIQKIYSYFILKYYVRFYASRTIINTLTSPI